ncbi:MAG: ribosome assembly factor SBDS [Candidatus Methanospirareceae archaeon]
MVSLEEAAIARYKRGKKNFEILVDPIKAELIREGVKKEVDDDVLAVEEVFEEASKGKRATEESLRSVFSTTDVREIALKIIKEGEIQLTTEQRRRKVEEKRKKVIDRICRISINPQTNTPHPPTRIEVAMKEAKVHIDPFKSVDELVNETIKAIRHLIPIKIEEKEIAVKIPPAYTGRVYEIKNKYEVVKEEWQSDGSFIGLFKIPAGIKDEFLAFLNKITKGEVQVKIIK